MSQEKRASRSNSNGEQLAMPTSTSAPNPQKVMLLKDSIAGCGRAECVQLKHPRSGAATLFLLAADDAGTTHLSELNTFDEGNRSWFIGNTVIADGRLHIATPYNPAYLILPYLIKAERNVPLDQLLEDDQFPEMVRLAAVAAGRLDAVADSKGAADLNVWKYNAEKTQSWLEKRCRQLQERLMEKKVPTTTAQALTFVRTMDQQQTLEAYLVLAHGILSDYLPEEISNDLRRRLQLPEKIRPKQKASSEGENQPQPKKQKTEGPAEDYTSGSPAVKKASAPISSKSRALAKNAVGNKSIMSFFAKK